MANRFTDTGKWDHAWFRQLSPKMKCAWLCLLDRCDMAGFWEIDLDLLSFVIGENITPDDLNLAFGDRITWYSRNKLLIQGFIAFQQKVRPEDLNPANNCHFSIIKILNKNSDLMPCSAPPKGLVRGYSNSNSNSNIIKKGQKFEKEKLIEAYSRYPLKKGKQQGLAKLMRDIKSDEDLELLKKAIEKYRKDCETNQTEAKYIMHFSTFANSWRDWLDADVGRSEVGQSSLSDIISRLEE